MLPLPQLLEEDVLRLEEVLNELISQSEANAALVIDKGGFLIAQRGSAAGLDATTLAALAAGSFMANQQIAGLIDENTFNAVYQQGERTSILVQSINDQSLLVVVFGAAIGVGVVRYYSGPAIEHIGAQLQLAHDRDPGAGLDLSLLNVADTSEVFRRK